MKIKKIAKITGISLLVIVLLLAVAPFLFKGKIIALVKESINNSVNARVDFASADLSFFRNFPQASIILEDVEVINNAPFDNDTLFYGKEVAVVTGIGELFKGADEAIQIYSFTIEDAKLDLKIDKDGNANYDIAKPADSTTASNATTDFKFQIDDYHIRNTNITYTDIGDNMILVLKNVQHEGFGDFSLDKSELETTTDAIVSFGMEGLQYVDEQQVNLDALIAMDLTTNTYTFLENQALINQLPLTVDGFVKVNEDSQDIQLAIKTPSSDFKNFLAVIPKEYAKNITDVKTSGNFEVTGTIQGISNAERIPNIDIRVVSNDASFKYPDLPKSVRNINIDAKLLNTTGKTDDTYLQINNLMFQIDEDRFKADGILSQLTTNPTVNANIDGRLNLANISKAYPIEFDKELSGILEADLTTTFDMAAIENKIYSRIKSNGKLNVSDFEFSSKDIVNPLRISEAAVNFVPGKITLQKFDATSGKSDFSASGTIENLLGFLFNKGELKGNFTVNSKAFHVNDFMTASKEGSKNTSATAKQGEALKIPEFLDCTLYANADRVYYDNIELSNVKGSLALDNGDAILNNISSDIFDGKITMSGVIATNSETPTFTMDLNMDSFDLSKSFSQLELLQSIVPVAKALNGKLNTKISLEGDLGENYTPQISSISGNAFAELLTTTLKSSNIDLFNTINEKLTFIDLNKISLDDIKTKLSFEDGRVNVKPFSFNYKDIKITMSGTHGFDQSMNYTATFEIPATYLGSEVTSLLADIDSPEVKNITIPVSSTITGTLSNPGFSTDLASATKDLVKKLAKLKAQQAIGNIDTGSDTVNDILGDIVKGNQTQKDSTVTTPNSTSDGVKSLLGGFLKKRQERKAAEEQARKEAEAKAAADEAKKQQEKAVDSTATQ